jgi:hypothetical protein
MFQWLSAILRSKPPQPQPIHCPSCGATEHDIKIWGVWDGAPCLPGGSRPHGSLVYGICKGCGSRWGKWDDASAYVPSVEEWNREVPPDPELLWARGHDPLL